MRWTPNVSGGPTVGKTVCNATLFGSGKTKCNSEVYDTAYVNGEIVAVGAFTEACQPGPTSSGMCTPGTQVVRNDIFAYSARTGVIDPNFAPQVDRGPVWSVAAGPGGTVYIGGGFTTVNGTAHSGVAQLYVNPGVTSGSNADGALDTTFAGIVAGSADDVALSPDGTALYVAGAFSAASGSNKFANGAKVQGVARMDAVTGALDKTFAFTLGQAINSAPPKVEAMALSADGSRLAFSGTALQVNGQSRPRLAVVNTGGTLGAPSSLADWRAPILADNCSAEHDYVRGLDFAPDGSFLVIGDTGYQNDGSQPFSVCDAVARFEVNSANTTSTGTQVNVAPTWIDYAGGDSFDSIAIAGNVVYAGGHQRWVNNFCGSDAVCGPNAVLVNGLAALDANTGVGLAWWHPETTRGSGVWYLGTFPAGTYDGGTAGLIIGTDVNMIAGSHHAEQAIFPMAAATSPTRGGAIPSGMFIEEGGTNTANPMCMDAAGNGMTSGTPVVLSTCLNIGEQTWSVGTDGTIDVNGLCLDTQGGGTAAGTPAVLNTCSGVPTQQWSQGAGNTLVNAGASACLDDHSGSTTSGVQLQIEPCSGARSQVWPLPAAQGPPAGPAVGPIFPQLQTSTRQVPCLDDLGNSLAAGTKVVLLSCQGLPQQNWTVGSDGTIRIGGTDCVDMANPSQHGAVPVVLNPCNGSASQVWTPNGTLLVNQGATALNGTSYCLDDPGANTKSNTQVQVYACNGGNNQRWRLPGV